MMIQRSKYAAKCIMIDMIGNKYNKLTVISEMEYQKYGRRCYLCKCDCGNEKVIVGESIRYGRTTSCGCYAKSKVTKHGMADTSSHVAWSSMRQRCTTETHKQYHNYGGRGIKVCDRWMDSYENFLSDMGIRPTKKHSLDRIDNNGDYTPDNCRWATSEQQLNNRRVSRFIELDGIKLTVAQWSRKLNITESKIHHRLRTGKTPKECLKV